MLRELRIRNFAIIDSLELTFDSGFLVFTGETGAGKSILIDALGLLIGGRAAPEYIRTGCEEAVVEARFEPPDDEWVGRRLQSIGIDPLDEPALLIRRILSRSDRSRVTINGQLATVSQLARLCAGLVNIHGQQDYQSLLSTSDQLELLDRFGLVQPAKEAYQSLYGRYRELEQARLQLESADRDRLQRIDLLTFQLSELDAAHVCDGEESTLTGELARLRHAAQLAAAAEESYQLLSDNEPSLLTQMARVHKLVKTMAQVDAELESAANTLDTVAIHLKELSQTMRDYGERLSHDPKRLEEMEDRLVLIAGLKKKHGCADEAALLAHATALRQELEPLTTWGDRHAAVMEERERLLTQLEQSATRLSSVRRQAAERFRRQVERELAQLKMEQATCEVRCTPMGASHYQMDGWDQVEFLVTANRGEELKPLRKVASGGELSRLMLAIESVLGRADRVPVLVFDEVDAGIGGAVAELVGRRLKSLAQGRQLLCVTHLPQVAAFADRHYVVEKIGKKGRTVTTLRALDRKAQVAELARMVGGSSITEATRRHAEELLLAGRAGGE